jgi:hypothetical protein
LNKLYQQKHKDSSETLSAINPSARVGSRKSEEGGTSEYLIFERHFDDKKGGGADDNKQNSDADNSSQGAMDSANHDEDLGIIDLDELEKEDGLNGTSSSVFDD